MYWIWLIIVVALTLVLLVAVPQNVLRTAIGNCTRADGSKSSRRRQIEIRCAWSYVGGIVVIPIILVVIHVNVTMLVEHFYVDYIPQEWVVEIERADTIDNDVNEALAEFAEWNEKQQLFSPTNKGSWQEAIWNNWMFFAADVVLMGIAFYFILGRYYLLLVSNYTKGVERRHRTYARIDRKRSSEDINNAPELQNGETGSEDDESLVRDSDREETQEVISPYMDLNSYIKELSREGFLDAVFNGLVLPAKHPALEKNKEGEPAVIPEKHGVVDQARSNEKKSSDVWRQSTLGGLHKIENELKALCTSGPKDESTNDSEILTLQKQISELNQKINEISRLQSGELSMPESDDASRAVTKAALFCLMDTSSSMDKFKLDIARRFFILLFLFLQRIYGHIKVIYIQHHATAEEIDEDGFFEPRQQSGTVISSSLELMHSIIQERFTDSEWMLYAAQVSDGVNKEDDYTRCMDVLETDILHLLQYYIYIETVSGQDHTLWREYEALKVEHDNLAMQRIDDVDTLYTKFRSLFDKRLN